jgi:hypothetical protein
MSCMVADQERLPLPGREEIGLATSDGGKYSRINEGSNFDMKTFAAWLQCSVLMLLPFKASIFVLFHGTWW